MDVRDQLELNIALRLELVGSLLCKKRELLNKHQHSFYEFIYISKGEVEVSINSEKYLLKGKDTIIIPPRTIHSFFIKKDNTKLLYIGFRLTTENSIYQENEFKDYFLIDTLKDKNVVYKMAENLVNTKLSDKTVDYYWQYQIFEGLKPIVEYLSKDTKYDILSGNSTKSIICRKVIKYLDMNINRFVSVEEIADNLYLSAHYLGVVFSNTTKTTIKEYQMSLKMEKANSLIRNSNCNLNEIADELGFSSLQYFSKCFKNYYGFTPISIKNK